MLITLNTNIGIVHNIAPILRTERQNDTHNITQTTTIALSLFDREVKLENLKQSKKRINSRIEKY